MQLAEQHRVVLTYGRFDLFNQNHIEFLRQLSKMGDELIVGCTVDSLAELENRPCQQGFEDRRAILESCRYVSRVIAEETPDQKHTDIVNYNVSVVVMSDIWAGELDHLRDVTQVRYLMRHGDNAQKTGFQTVVSA